MKEPIKLKVQPVVNVTKLAIFGMALAAWTVFWIARAGRAMARAKDTS